MIHVKPMSVAKSALVERRIIAAAIKSSLEDTMAQDPDSLKVACANCRQVQGNRPGRCANHWTWYFRTPSQCKKHVRRH